MSDFRQRSGGFTKELANAAAWMMRENVGDTHWWRQGVLTAQNKNLNEKNVVSQETAREIFDELESRGLLIKRHAPADGSAEPDYLMRYDIAGWDKAVSEGKPLFALLMKVNREWRLYLLTFFAAVVMTFLTNHAVVFVDKAVGLAK